MSPRSMVMPEPVLQPGPVLEFMALLQLWSVLISKAPDTIKGLYRVCPASSLATTLGRSGPVPYWL